jgi:hypothetical protein
MILSIYNNANTVLSLVREKCNDHFERKYLLDEISNWEAPKFLETRI